MSLLTYNIVYTIGCPYTFSDSIFLSACCFVFLIAPLLFLVFLLISVSSRVCVIYKTWGIGYIVHLDRSVGQLGDFLKDVVSLTLMK